MKRQDQTVKHAPPESHGDCWRTTIANPLEIESSSVPHFLHDGCDIIEAIRRLNDYLRQFGLAYIQIETNRELLGHTGISGLYHEGCGDTERGTFHSAAFCDFRLEHDPHPSHVGFTRVTNTIGVFVALKPWKFIK